ncbi:MAG: uroporphyrinogen-III C-methyltransferase [Burkholderiales bacterium]|nr:uroporphyrinogen-III C-methyltransferase [Burkholderiales bacterium]
MSGTVYLVGAGPGAPDLLTVRAARLLAQADIVFHDALVPPATLALAARARLVPVGGRCGAHASAQRFVHRRLAEAARRHAVVVRLKGGDPMLFGRAAEEIEYLVGRGIRVEVVPGVTAALAAAAELAAPLTRRNRARSVLFVTPRCAGDGRSDDWAAAASLADSVAIYMGAGEAARIARELIAAGRPAETPVAIVENASLAGARCLRGTLVALPQLAAPLQGGPALILVGEAARPAVCSPIIEPCPSARSSSSPTAQAIRAGQSRFAC